MDTKQFESMWTTRPVRPGSGRTVGGVCAGIGARYRVDPTLVKVAFVVATLFGGSGLVLYVAAWIVLPSADRAGAFGPSAGGRSSRRRGHGRPHGNGKFILLVVLAIVVLTSVGPRGAWGSGGLVGAALMLVGWWLLYQRTPQPPAGTSADTYSQEPVASPSGAGTLQRWTPRGFTGMSDTPTAPTTTRNTETSAAQSFPYSDTAYATAPGSPAPQFAAANDAGTGLPPRTPPAWDPLGTAQFAWDLPEPAPDQPGKRRAPLTLVVLGVAVIVAAAGIAAHQAGVDWFTPARIASLALAVVAVGLILTGLRRRPDGSHSAGLVPIGILLAVVVFATTAATHLHGLPPGGAGDRTWKPLSENDIRPAYSTTLGTATLDLRDVDLTTDRTVDVRTGFGEVHVLVPADMNIRANCSTRAGELSCPDGLSRGNSGGDHPVLTVDASSTAGDVKVIR